MLSWSGEGWNDVIVEIIARNISDQQETMRRRHNEGELHNAPENKIVIRPGILLKVKLARITTPDRVAFLDDAHTHPTPKNDLLQTKLLLLAKYRIKLLHRTYHNELLYIICCRNRTNRETTSFIHINSCLNLWKMVNWSFPTFSMLPNWNGCLNAQHNFYFFKKRLLEFLQCASWKVPWRLHYGATATSLYTLFLFNQFMSFSAPSSDPEANWMGPVFIGHALFSKIVDAQRTGLASGLIVLITKFTCIPARFNVSFIAQTWISVSFLKNKTEELTFHSDKCTLIRN